MVHVETSSGLLFVKGHNSLAIKNYVSPILLSQRYTFNKDEKLLGKLGGWKLGMRKTRFKTLNNYLLQVTQNASETISQSPITFL